MIEIDARQQAMLKEMGIRLPWRTASSEGAPEAATLAPSAQPVRPPHVPQASSSASVPPPADIKRQITSLLTPKPAPEQALAPSSPKIDSEHLQIRAQQIAHMSLTELEDAARQCQSCDLCTSRQQVAFSAGISTAEWMIIGEAPGEQEDKQGQPFVGPAGQLLDRMLAQLNLSRTPTEQQKPVYIANVLKCRPPRNRNPEPEEMAMCAPFLKRQIELVQPKVILVVGRFAVQTLLNTQEAIGRLRGQVHHYNGIPAIVTYHPAYLLRNPVDKRKSWEDLCLATQTYSLNA
ncbi:MAG: uracil-DNA glycosylase [Saezia sp.]